MSGVKKRTGQRKNIIDKKEIHEEENEQKESSNLSVASRLSRKRKGKLPNYVNESYNESNVVKEEKHLVVPSPRKNRRKPDNKETKSSKQSVALDNSHQSTVDEDQAENDNAPERLLNRKSKKKDNEKGEDYVSNEKDMSPKRKNSADNDNDKGIIKVSKRSAKNQKNLNKREENEEDKNLNNEVNDVKSRKQVASKKSKNQAQTITEEVNKVDKKKKPQGRPKKKYRIPTSDDDSDYEYVPPDPFERIRTGEIVMPRNGFFWASTEEVKMRAQYKKQTKQKNWWRINRGGRGGKHSIISDY